MSACSWPGPNTPALPVPTVSPTPAQTATTTRPPQTPLSVRLYHCGFLPFKHNGQTWEVSDPTPYYAGNPPPKWKGKGRVVALAADHLRYRDNSGFELDFVPVAGKIRGCA